MSVLIKMVMPQNCRECRLVEIVNRHGRVRYICIALLNVITNLKERLDTCPLEELPDHGDLIDRDEAADDACLIWGRNSSGDDAAQEIIEHLRKMKAVIPAERSEASLCDGCDEPRENCSWCKRMERSEE